METQSIDIAAASALRWDDTPHWSRSCRAMSGTTPRGLAADQADDGRAVLRTAMAGRVIALGVGAIRDDPSVWTTARWPQSLAVPAAGS